MEEIRDKVLDLIRQKTGRPVSPNDSFGDLELDSLAMAELAYEVEQMLGVKADSGVLDCATVADFIDYATELKGRLQSH